MQEDLIFHAVSRRKWTQLNKNGTYAPETYDREEGIRCALPEMLQQYLNTNFKGRKNLFLLVIDLSRLSNAIQRRKDSGYLYLSAPVNIDAILDKIRIDAGPDGTFDVQVESFT